jgi:hypothetical protein
METHRNIEPHKLMTKPCMYCINRRPESDVHSNAAQNSVQADGRHMRDNTVQRLSAHRHSVAVSGGAAGPASRIAARDAAAAARLHQAQ